jgi:hypothetical protein
VVCHISHGPAVIDVPLPEIEAIWPMLVDILGCRSAWPAGIHPGFRPDMGLAGAKAGLMTDADGKKFYHFVSSVRLLSVAKIKDGTYGINGVYGGEADSEIDTGAGFMVRFDFGPATYPKFLAELPGETRERVRVALSQQTLSLLPAKLRLDLFRRRPVRRDSPDEFGRCFRAKVVRQLAVSPQAHQKVRIG